MRHSCRGVVIDFAELSDPGREPTKQINEDACGHAETPLGFLAVVCDGMGGHSAGREASTNALRSVLETAQAAQTADPRSLLRQALDAAATAVWNVGGDAPQELRPGSTCVSVLVHERGADVAHVGDSRVYLVRGGSISRLTRDHSMVQQMLDAGMISDADAADHPDANKITRALGMTPTVEVELCDSTVALRSGDVIVLCTDGLTDLVGDAEIASVVTHSGALEGVCRALVTMANDRGGHDNITVQALRIETMPQPGAHGTVVMDGGSPRTVVDEPARKPGRTLPDAPSRTILDEPATSGERTTLPGDAPSTERRPSAEIVDAPSRGRPTVGARAMVLAAAGIAAAIVAAVAIWWLSSAVPKKDTDEPPPPPEPVTARSTTVLEPLPTPSATVEPVRPAIVDAGQHEADARDAGRDAEAGSP